MENRASRDASQSWSIRGELGLWRILLLLATPLWCSPDVCAGAQYLFQVDGFITLSNAVWQRFNGNDMVIAGKTVRFNVTNFSPTKLQERFCDFSAAVSNKCSIIWAKYFNGESFVCGTDGLDSYLLNEMTPARERNPPVQEFAWTTAGPFPSKALTPIQLVWIAFCSAEHLDGDLSLDMEAFHQRVPSQKPEMMLLSKPSKLPQRVRWWAPPEIVPLKLHHPPPAYTNGWLAAEFRVTSTTNLFGSQLPLKFEFSLYTRRSSFGAHEPLDVDCFEMLEGSVTNITAIRYEGDFLPTLGTNVAMQEFRFEKLLGYGYPAPRPHGHWPKRDDPHVKALFQTYMASHPVRHFAAARPVAVSLLFLSLLALPVIMIWRAVAKRNIKQQQ